MAQFADCLNVVAGQSRSQQHCHSGEIAGLWALLAAERDQSEYGGGQRVWTSHLDREAVWELRPVAAMWPSGHARAPRGSGSGLTRFACRRAIPSGSDWFC